MCSTLCGYLKPLGRDCRQCNKANGSHPLSIFTDLQIVLFHQKNYIFWEITLADLMIPRVYITVAWQSYIAITPKQHMGICDLCIPFYICYSNCHCYPKCMKWRAWSVWPSYTHCSAPPPQAVWVIHIEYHTCTLYDVRFIFPYSLRKEAILNHTA